MTYKEKILKCFVEPKDKFSCAEICSKIIKEERLSENAAYRLNASVSSQLKKMINQKILKYAKSTTPRGGCIYQLNP